jgi:predicted TIM-barrel fold metal-dependent hydrolase
VPATGVFVETLLGRGSQDDVQEAEAAINRLAAALLPNYYDAAHQYLPQDYRADVNAMPMTASIACEFGAADGVAEAIWVQQCADRLGIPNAFIAAVQLDSPNLPGVLARYRDLSMVRAVREPMYWAADPIKRLGARGT